MKLDILKILVMSLLLAFMPTSLRSAAMAAGDDSFTRYDKITCEGTTVSVETTCLEDNGDVFCPYQALTFRNGPEGVNRAFRYTYRKVEGWQEFVAGVVCVTDAGGSGYIVLEKTNYGNCNICEWIDVFTKTGKYVGSSTGMYATDFKRQRLSKAKEDSIYEALGHSSSIGPDKISITRCK